ncbi:hypothetical protein C8Q79DRAFT_186865 [Trametes meyenii]|nr:hypothetical protein C8Q79DRAFT_186865 [Trametes meyenii]
MLCQRMLSRFVTLSLCSIWGLGIRALIPSYIVCCLVFSRTSLLHRAIEKFSPPRSPNSRLLIGCDDHTADCKLLCTEYELFTGTFTNMIVFLLFRHVSETFSHIISLVLIRLIALTK